MRYLSILLGRLIKSMAMVDLFQYVDELKNSFGISEPEFSIALSQFMVNNDWFGINPIKGDDKYYITNEDIAKISDKVNDFCKNYKKDYSEKAAILLQKLDMSMPKTAESFDEYKKSAQMSDETSYYILDFLLINLAGELYLADDKEIEDIMNASFDLPLVHACVVAEYINWLSKNSKTVYKNIYFPKSRTSKATQSEAYDQEYYLRILFCMFNSDYIDKNEMYVKAADSKNYIDTWLFISLHFICALRNTDLIRLPHPRLNMSPKAVLEKIRKNQFTDDDARLTLYSITWTLSCLPMKPHKTLGTQGISDIQFHVPESVEVHMGKLFAIAEAHFQLSGSDSASEPLVRVITSYGQITRYMGEEIGELFLESDFRTRKANKSYLQMIYLLTDEIIDNNDDFNVKGYILAALARSHKGTYGEFASQTARYLKDAKMNGYSPEFVARELFERGVLSFVSSMLLKVITDGEYNKLSPQNQTKLICELNLTPLEIDNVMGLSQNAYSQATKITNEIIKSNTPIDIVKILHRIGNGNAVSKTDGCLCLVTAMKKMCPYNDKATCIGCEYEVSTKTTLGVLVNEYKRLLDEYDKANSEIIKERNKTMVKSVILPKLNEILVCVEQNFGSEIKNSLETIIKEYNENI